MRKLIFIIGFIVLCMFYYTGKGMYISGSSDKVPSDNFLMYRLTRDTVKTTEYYDSMFFVRQERFDTVNNSINVIYDTIDYWAYLDGELITKKQIVYESACHYFPVLMSKCKE